MKVLILLWGFFVSLSLHAEVCKFDFQKEPPKFDNDCVECGSRIQSPSQKVERLINPLMTAMSTSSSDELTQMKSMESFLSSKDIEKRCENINDLKKYFALQFNKNKNSCAEGPSAFARNKELCNYVITNFNKATMDMFETLLFTKKADGSRGGFIKGMDMMKLDFAILEHATWCAKSQKAWGKEKLFFDCIEIAEWAKEVNQISMMQSTFARERALENGTKIDKEKERLELFRKGCKAFEKPGTHNNFTSKLYLACVSSQQ
jgi:hypothetical protein